MGTELLRQEFHCGENVGQILHKRIVELYWLLFLIACMRIIRVRKMLYSYEPRFQAYGNKAAK